MSDLLEYNGYQGTVEFSKGDGLLFGRVLHIDSLIQYEGSSVAEIKTSFEEAVDAYLSFCKKCGRSPNKPYSGTFNVRIGPALHREAIAAATEKEQSLNEYVRDAIKSAVARATDSPATSQKHWQLLEAASLTRTFLYSNERTGILPSKLSYLVTEFVRDEGEFPSLQFLSVGTSQPPQIIHQEDMPSRSENPNESADVGNQRTH